MAVMLCVGARGGATGSTTGRSYVFAYSILYLLDVLYVYTARVGEGDDVAQIQKMHTHPVHTPHDRTARTVRVTRHGEPQPG